MPAITATLGAGLTALTSALTAGAGVTAAAAGLGGAASAAGGAAAAGAAGGLGAGLATGAAAGFGGAAGTAGLVGGGASAAGITGALGTIGTIGGLAGTGIQTYYGMQAAEASQQAEALRQRQAELQTAREHREAIRQAQLARATSINSLAGATGEISPLVSSAYGGAVGTSQGNLAYQRRAIEDNAAISQGLFQANAAQSQAQGFAQLGGGVGSLFGQLANPNVATAGGRLGKTIFDLV